MKYLLDTVVCIQVMRGVPQVIQRLQQTSPDDCVVSSVTIYELYTGVYKCSRPHKEQGKVDYFLKQIHHVAYDREAALLSAKIRADLERQGQTIGPYDLLLAGQALAREMILITSNVREFSRIADLAWEDWAN